MDVSENEIPGQTVVGETYEENLLRKVENLGEKRARRPPRRFDEECNVADLTADIDEPSNISEALTGEHSVQRKEAIDAEYDSLILLLKGRTS